MADHPILFKPEMVRALLDGRKTQTRRVIKPQPDSDFTLFHAPEVHSNGWYQEHRHSDTFNGGKLLALSDDRLWVKETWRPHSLGETNWDVEILYAADAQRIIVNDGEFGDNDWNWPKAAEHGNVSPLFMPRWASRLTLTVTNVRVERLQSISDDDAIAEGIQPSEEFTDRYLTPDGNYAVPRVAFKRLWDSINAKPRPVKDDDGKVSHYVSYPWAGDARTNTYRGKLHHIHPNPWVAAYTFDVVKGNIDRIGGAA